MRSAVEIGHVLRRDGRGMSMPLGVFFILLALHPLDLMPTADGFGRFAYRIPFGFIPALACLLVAAVLQGDGPANDRAFWSTRPLSRLNVFVAKLMFVAFCIIVPAVAVEAFTFWRLDPGAPIVTMAFDSAVHLAGLAMVTAVAASVTRSIQGTFVLLLTLWMASSLLQMAGRLLDPAFGWAWRWTPDVQYATVLVCMALCAHQFVTARRRRTMVLGSALFLSLPPLLSDRAFPPGALQAPPASAEADWLDTMNIGVELDSLYVSGPVRLTGATTFPEVSISTGGKLHVPDGMAVGIVRMESRVHGRDLDERFDFRVFRSRPSHEFPFHHHLELNGLRPVGTEPSNAGMFVPRGLPVAGGTRQKVERLESAGSMDLTLGFELYEWKVVGTLPLQRNAETSLADGTKMVLSSIDSGARHLNLELRHQWVPTSPSIEGPIADFQDRFAIALISSAYAEFAANVVQARGYERETVLGAAWLGAGIAQVEFNARFFEGRDGPRLPDDWFQEVELIVLQLESVGLTTRTFRWDIDGWPQRGLGVPIERFGKRIPTSSQYGPVAASVR